MQDKIYVNEDIPEEYQYFDFQRDYFDIYNKETFSNETTTVYRVYYSISPNTYYTYDKTFNQYNTSSYIEYPRTDDICYRSDFPQIVQICMCFAIIFIFLCNIVTSIYKKGGVFSGLL